MVLIIEDMGHNAKKTMGTIWGLAGGCCETQIEPCLGERK